MEESPTNLRTIPALTQILARIHAVAPWSQPDWSRRAVAMVLEREDARRVGDVIAIDVGVGRNLGLRERDGALEISANRTREDAGDIDELVWELARPICRALTVGLETFEGVLSIQELADRLVAMPAVAELYADDETLLTLMRER